MINGFAAEQEGTPGLGVAVLVDPETTDAPEIEAATKLLPRKGIFVRGYQGPGATVRAVSELVELFPYDLLIIATHCGDDSGYRWTYEFTDSEGINRTLVVRSLAAEGTPIVINNACSSWHRLAETFTFGIARAYIGTVFMISTSEAHGVVVRLLDKHFGKPLPLALWAAQREVYGQSVRRPYMMTGIYPQRLRVQTRGVPKEIICKLSHSLREWRKKLRHADPKKTTTKSVKDNVTYYEPELKSFTARWFSD